MRTTHSPALEAALLAVAAMPSRRDPEGGAAPPRRGPGGADADGRAGDGAGAARRPRGPRARLVAPVRDGAVTTET